MTPLEFLPPTTIAEANGVTTGGNRFKGNFENGPIAAVQQAMEVYPRDNLRGAKAIGMSASSYSLIRKLLILQSQHIPQQHKDTIARALANIEATRRTAEARTMARELLQSLWQKRRDTQIRKRHKRLDQTLIHIRESCESTKEMEIPRDLSPLAAREAVATLAASAILIGQLMRRLLGEDES